MVGTGRGAFTPPVVSLEIIDGKVWLQADNTDPRIAERLEEVGITKGDIVLGFQPPHVRPYTEYAVTRHSGEWSQAWRADRNRRATFISEITAPLPDRGAVDCLQIVERDRTRSIGSSNRAEPPPEKRKLTRRWKR